MCKYFSSHFPASSSGALWELRLTKTQVSTGRKKKDKRLLEIYYSREDEQQKGKFNGPFGG